MKKYVIKLNDKVYEVEMEEVTGEAAATVSETVKPVQTSNAPQSGASETIAAPMPGTIIKVAVKAGDQIKKGQVLVVLEAMKMENEIVSPVDGKIVSVGVTTGQAVNAGDTLVQIG